MEYGTAAHVIRAKKGRMLAVGVATVSHPGARKQPFMRPAFDNKQREAVQAFADYLRKRLATKHGINVPAPADEADDNE